jgi:hypothetical protein
MTVLQTGESSHQLAWWLCANSLFLTIVNLHLDAAHLTFHANINWMGNLKQIKPKPERSYGLGK